MADGLTGVRFLAAAAILGLAFAGQSRYAAATLILTAATAVIDGRLARRRRPSRHGAHLDAGADAALLCCIAVALVVLHPEIAAQNSALVASVGFVYILSSVASWRAFRSIVDPSRVSSKMAGGLLYAFALLTLATGFYEPLLYMAAAAALLVSSLSTLIAAIRTIHAVGTRSSARSHNPHHGKEVASNTAPASSIATSANAAASENRL